MALILGSLAYVLGVLSHPGQHAEAAALEATTINYNPGFPLSIVSPMFILFALGSISVLAIIRWGITRAVVILGASGLAIGASQVLKQKVLERPDLWEIGASNTFPSGHATVFAVLCLALIVVVPASLRAFAAVFGACVLSFTAAQILLAGWHRPSDVFGAIMLALACYAAFLWLFPPKNNTNGFAQGFARGILRISGAVVTIAAGLLALCAWFFSSHEAMMWAGITAIAAASCYACITITDIISRGK